MMMGCNRSFHHHLVTIHSFVVFQVNSWLLDCTSFKYPKKEKKKDNGGCQGKKKVTCSRQALPGKETEKNEKHDLESKDKT